MSSIPKPHRIPIEDMEIFELLQEAIPRGESDYIGRLCGCGGQTVRNWRNDPDTEENHSAEAHGRRSPLDHFLQFLDAVNARHPEGADMIMERIEYEYAAMKSIHGRKNKLSIWQAVKRANALARELLAVTDLDGDEDG